MITEPDKQWPTFKTEFEYEVCLSTIAYITVRVKAPNPRAARGVVEYSLKGQDEIGQHTFGRKDIFVCRDCAAHGVKLSKDGLVLDYVNEVPDEPQLILPA